MRKAISNEIAVSTCIKFSIMNAVLFYWELLSHRIVMKMRVRGSISRRQQGLFAHNTYLSGGNCRHTLADRGESEKQRWNY
jgi:hypothetical protein